MSREQQHLLHGVALSVREPSTVPAHTQPVCVTVGAACARNIRDRRCWCDTCLTVGNDVRDTRVTVGNDARSACGRREQCVFRVS